MLCATKVSGRKLTADLEVSQNSIRVHNILFLTTNAAGQGPIDIEDIDGNVILTVMVRPNDPLEIETTWIAGNGLVVKAGGVNTYCTVWYSYDGV